MPGWSSGRRSIRRLAPVTSTTVARPARFRGSTHGAFGSGHLSTLSPRTDDLSGPETTRDPDFVQRHAAPFLAATRTSCSPFRAPLGYLSLITIGNG